MGAVADARGLKRICMSCGTRFYDMNKRPIVCPSCETEFTGEIKVKTRRSRSAVATEGQVSNKTAKNVANDDDDEIEDDDVVSINDVNDGDDDDEDDEDLGGDLDLDDLEDDDDMDDDDDELDGLEGDVDIDKNSSND